MVKIDTKNAGLKQRLRLVYSRAKVLVGKQAKRRRWVVPDTKGKLIIVDDEDFLRDSIAARIVQQFGFDVKTAANGKDALELILAHNPDAVMTDIVMPDMDGLQLLRTVRQRGIDTPFLLVTGYPSPAVLETAMQLGAHDFLEKPCDVNKIIAAAKASVEFGIMLKQVNAEIDVECAKSGLSGEELKQFRDVRKATLLQQKMGWIPDDEG